MNPPNCYDEGVHQLFPTDNPDFGQEKAALTRRKNAEAQKLYRERKKAYEAGLLSTVQTLQEKINRLETQLAYEREKQNQAAWPWIEPVHQPPAYTQNQAYLSPTNPAGRYFQNSSNFGALDAKCMQPNGVDAMFQDQPLHPF